MFRQKVLMNLIWKLTGKIWKKISIYSNKQHLRFFFPQLYTTLKVCSVFGLIAASFRFFVLNMDILVVKIFTKMMICNEKRKMETD